MKKSLFAPLILCAALVLPGWSGASAGEPSRYAVKAARILTVTGGIIEGGIVLVNNGKIERIAGSTAVPPDYRLIDASDKWLLPGFVDAHSHSGGEGWQDINEAVYQLNPDLQILDVIALNTSELKRAVAGGVTAINFMPGSASNNGGTGIVMKTAGDDLDAVVVRFPGVLKIAQAGNPERALTGEIGAGRMGMTWQLRMLMKEIKAYHDTWTDYRTGKTKVPPERDIRYENIPGIFDGTLPVFIHSAWFQPVQEVFRLYLEEFGIRTAVITHGEFGAYRNGPAVARRLVRYDCGPRLYDFEEDAFHGIATEYAKGGVKEISLNTDSFDSAPERLCLQAAMAVRLGFDEDKALEAITINPARALGLERRIGSIEAGKDADLVVWTGNPLDVRNHVVLTLVDGKIVYDSAKEGQRY
jgi:imidazolonepropionase-like amidohydrolase